MKRRAYCGRDNEEDENKQEAGMIGMPNRTNTRKEGPEREPSVEFGRREPVRNTGWQSQQRPSLNLNGLDRPWRRTRFKTNRMCFPWAPHCDAFCSEARPG
jgi:hypothetical protein